MSKAQQYTKLAEAFLKGFIDPDNGVYHEVFENPTRSELEDLAPNIRFIALPNEKLIVWNGYEVIHDVVAKQLKLNVKSKILICGEADYSRGTMNVVDLSLYNPIEQKRTLENNDWSWTNKYGLRLEEYIHTHYPNYRQDTVKRVDMTPDEPEHAEPSAAQKRLSAMRKFR